MRWQVVDEFSFSEESPNGGLFFCKLCEFISLNTKALCLGVLLQCY